MYGLYPALVSDIKDPDGLGRVKVTLPQTPDTTTSYEAWARLATMMAGNNRGSWFVPDETTRCSSASKVAITPVRSSSARSERKAHAAADDGRRRSQREEGARFRNGVKITLDDTDGQEQLVLETPGGQKVTLKDGAGAVLLEDSNGNASSSSQTDHDHRVREGDGQREHGRSSAGMLTVNAGMSTFSGVVKADTVITNSVVRVVHTRRKGNIL